MTGGTDGPRPLCAAAAAATATGPGAKAERPRAAAKDAFPGIVVRLITVSWRFRSDLGLFGSGCSFLSAGHGPSAHQDGSSGRGVLGVFSGTRGALGVSPGALGVSLAPGEPTGPGQTFMLDSGGSVSIVHVNPSCFSALPQPWTRPLLSGLFPLLLLEG